MPRVQRIQRGVIISSLTLRGSLELAAQLAPFKEASSLRMGQLRLFLTSRVDSQYVKTAPNSET